MSSRTLLRRLVVGAIIPFLCGCNESDIQNAIGTYNTAVQSTAKAVANLYGGLDQLERAEYFRHTRYAAFLPLCANPRLAWYDPDPRVRPQAEPPTSHAVVLTTCSGLYDRYQPADIQARLICLQLMSDYTAALALLAGSDADKLTEDQLAQLKGPLSDMGAQINTLATIRSSGKTKSGTIGLDFKAMSGPLSDLVALIGKAVVKKIQRDELRKTANSYKHYIGSICDLLTHEMDILTMEYDAQVAATVALAADYYDDAIFECGNSPTGNRTQLVALAVTAPSDQSPNPRTTDPVKDPTTILNLANEYFARAKALASAPNPTDSDVAAATAAWANFASAIQQGRMHGPKAGDSSVGRLSAPGDLTAMLSDVQASGDLLSAVDEVRGVSPFHDLKCVHYTLCKCLDDNAWPTGLLSKLLFFWDHGPKLLPGHDTSIAATINTDTQNLLTATETFKTDAVLLSNAIDKVLGKPSSAGSEASSETTGSKQKSSKASKKSKTEGTFTTMAVPTQSAVTPIEKELAIQVQANSKFISRFNPPAKFSIESLQAAQEPLPLLYITDGTQSPEETECTQDKQYSDDLSRKVAPARGEDLVVACAHRAALECFSAATDKGMSNSERKMLIYKGLVLNAFVSNIADSDFDAWTEAYNKADHVLVNQVAEAQHATAVLEDAVKHAQSAVEIARCTDDLLAVLAGIAKTAKP